MEKRPGLAHFFKKKNKFSGNPRKKIFKEKFGAWDLQLLRGSMQCEFNSSVFLKNGPIPPLFVDFRSFLVTISIQIEKSIDGVLRIRTWGRRMVGADKTTELWRPPLNHSVILMIKSDYKIGHWFWKDDSHDKEVGATDPGT